MNDSTGTHRLVHPRRGTVFHQLREEHNHARSESLGNLLYGLVVGNALVVVDISATRLVDGSLLSNLMGKRGAPVDG